MLKFSITSVIIAACYLVHSQGYQVNFQGQKQQGMGGAGTALPSDGAILFFNPGGASFLKQSSINAAITPTFSRILYTDSYTNNSNRTNSPTGTPFSFYGVYKKNPETKLALGLAIYTPFGSTIEYEEGWAGRFALTRLELKSIFIQPTVSYRISKKIGIGLGLIYSVGNVNLQKDIPVIDNNGAYSHAELSGKASGYGFNIGVHFRATEKLNIGLTYRSQVNMAVKDGEATFTVPSSIATNFPNGKFTSSLPLPQIATLGFAYSFSEKLAAVLDINYAGWKAYDTLAFDYENNTASLVDTKSARNYKNSFAFRGGVNYIIHPKFEARIGIAYALSPVQNGYVTPETPDANRVNFTIGAGYKISEHLQMDASLFFTHLERTDTNLETNLSGTYKTNVVAPGLAIVYNF